MEFRERPTFSLDRSYEKNAFGGSWSRSYFEPVTGWQQTTSQGHPWPAKRGSGMDVGGPFRSVRDWYDQSRLANGTYKDRVWGYRGNIFPGVPPNSFTAVRNELAITDSLTLAGMGATAIANTVPNNPASDLLTASVELVREGLPKAVGVNLLRDRSARGLASEHLNYQFGLVPFISDVKDLAHVVSNHDDLVKQIERDSGRNVRRKYEFPMIGSTKRTEFSQVWPSQSSGYSRNDGSGVVYRQEKRNVWFSGCYTYYMKLDKGLRGRMEYTADMARRLYGVRVSPAAVWNLTPWTWAIDWVSNAGDVLKNIEAFSNDGLVMRYGYIMSEQSIRYDRRWKGHVLGHPLVTADAYGVTSKVRQQATPYGFGLDPDGFSGRQISILAALGMTRRR